MNQRCWHHCRTASYSRKLIKASTHKCSNPLRTLRSLAEISNTAKLINWPLVSEIIDTAEGVAREIDLAQLGHTLRQGARSLSPVMRELQVLIRTQVEPRSIFRPCGPNILCIAGEPLVRQAKWPRWKNILISDRAPGRTTAALLLYVPMKRTHRSFPSSARSDFSVWLKRFRCNKL